MRRNPWWGVLTVSAAGVALAFALNSFLSFLERPRPISIDESRRMRVRNGAPKAGQTGLPPCLFLVPSSAKGQPVVSGSIADCLVLVPGDKELDLFEVNLRSGLFLPVKTDLFVPDTRPISFTRVHRPLDDWARRFEVFLNHVYDIFEVGDRHPYTSMDLILPDAKRLHYERISFGRGYADALYEHASTRTAFYESQVRWNGDGWDLALQDGTVYVFPEAYNAKRPAQAALIGIRDFSDNKVKLIRDADGKLIRIISSGGRWAEFSYAGNRMTQAKDSLGLVVHYIYDSYGRIRAVVGADGRTTQYTYDDSHLVLKVQDSQRVVVLRIHYDSKGRVTELTQADGGSYYFRYTTDQYGNPLHTDVIDPELKVKRVTFSGSTYGVTTQRSRSQPR